MSVLRRFFRRLRTEAEFREALNQGMHAEGLLVLVTMCESHDEDPGFGRGIIFLSKVWMEVMRDAETI